MDQRRLTKRWFAHYFLVGIRCFGLIVDHTDDQGFFQLMNQGWRRRMPAWQRDALFPRKPE